MACWKWFGALIKETGIEVRDDNQEKIDSIVHKYLNKQISYGRCSPNRKVVRKQIESDERMRKGLVEKPKALA